MVRERLANSTKHSLVIMQSFKLFPFHKGISTSVLWPITEDTDHVVKQSKANACSRHEAAQENVCEQVTISLGFSSDWL